MSSSKNGRDIVDALGREVARHSVERLGSGLARLTAETSASFRWCLSVLVLLNGGALYIAISARESLEPALFHALVIMFFAGLMLALVAALVGIAFMLPVAGAMRRAIMHWTEVSVTGVPTEDAVASARKVRRASNLWLTVMGLIGLCSLAAFASGALMLGERFGIIAPPSEEVAAPPEEEQTLSNEAALVLPPNAVEAVPAAEPAPLEAAVVPPPPVRVVVQPAPKPAPQAAAARPTPPQAAPAKPVAAKPAPAKPVQAQPARVAQPAPAPRPASTPPRPAQSPATPAPTVVAAPPPAPAAPIIEQAPSVD